MATLSSLKITVLVEDTSPQRPFYGELGLSLFIEVDDKKVLFGTGCSGNVLNYDQNI